MTDRSAVPGAGAATTPPAIDSRAAWLGALRWGFTSACDNRARRIVCCDVDLSNWPLDDTALLRQLTDWLHLPQRRLVLLAAGYDALPRGLPRFTAWRRNWAHAVEAWQASEDVVADLPSLLLDDRSVSVHLVDDRHWRGRVESDAGSARQWGERIDALLQRSAPAFAATTLGL